jgi:hypothetical protein
MLYNNETLNKHCLTNDIQLVNDYANVKINREFYIKGICKKITDNCDTIFNKNFRQLVKTGPYCYNCAIENGKQKYKLHCKYNLQYLMTFCNQNNIILTDEYSNKTINRDTTINGKCISQECEDSFNKSFRELVKLNGYCANCCKNNGKLKIIKTNLQKYGTKCALQSEIVKNKTIETNIIKYGVEHNSQLNYIKEQKKEKSLKKYGTKCPLQSEIVKNKTIETNIIKYGVENPQQNQDIRNKTIETNIKKYGVKHFSQTEEFKNKVIQTNLKKYGVQHHSQNAEVSEVMLKSAYNIKQYTFPSGKIISYQGYENFAFDDLLNIENVLEDDIFTNRTEVPELWYTDKSNKLRRHFVDIYIKSQNRCIEVKSTWTNQEKNNVLEKKQSAINLGYNYEIWIYNKKGNKLQVL